jgi:hypothetical protein
MRLVSRLTLFSLSAHALACVAFAQPPREGPGPLDGQSSGSVKDRIMARMMKFDTNKDGKLSKDEITDERLLRLFDRADANKDGVVTKEELAALATKMAAEESADGGRRGRFGPPGGPGGPGGPRGGPGGFGGPPRPGQILPPFVQERLNLSAEQKKELEALQKEVDRKLARLLTAEQKKQLEEMRRFGGPGPGGRGPGGPDGRGPGGPGEDGPPGPPPRE